MSADRRTAILDAALAAIAGGGVRGLRVEDVAAKAGVAVSLIYYHFKNRTGLIRAALDHANDRARRTIADTDGTGRERVDALLLAELDDGDDVRQTTTVWGEVLASAVFNADLREQLNAAGSAWTDLVAERIASGQADGSIDKNADGPAVAERLTALVDGLSARWLAGLLERERARELLAQAIALELD